MNAADVSFSPDRMETFHAIVRKYEVPASALLPVLYLAQEQFGFLSPPVMEYVAKLLEIPPRQVFEAASFYILFKRKDMGKWCLKPCVNITCTIMGAGKLVDIIQRDLKLAPMQVSNDGLFSYLPMQCIGACDHAPAIQINDEYFNDVTPDKFQAILDRLRTGRSVSRESEVHLS